QILNAWIGRYLEDKAELPDLHPAIAGSVMVPETGTGQFRRERNSTCAPRLEDEDQGWSSSKLTGEKQP
ncbi:MAG: hypothetical protein L0287_14910, partial [Anaerolineae bacterium]|nr:hypothetical protein [Anaerolineae bacterium]